MAEQHQNWLMNFPIAFFTTTMGMGGLTLALMAGEDVLGLGSIISTWVLLLTLLQFSAIFLCYVAKVLKHPESVKAEWNHPVQLALFPAGSISMLLLAAALYDWSVLMATILWGVGTVLQGVLTLAVISGWISPRSFQQAHLTPAWFIPVVGNVIVTFAGVPLGFMETSWFFLSAGLIFWIVLLSLVMNRLIFHDPLSERLQPTLIILIAPPALGFLGWVELMGHVDAFAHVLLNVAYLFGLVVVIQVPRLLRLSFTLSFWALSFPLAALTRASFIYAEETGSGAHLVIGSILLTVLCVTLLMLFWRTVTEIWSGRVFQPLS